MNWLERQAKMRPQSVALNFEEVSWTWQELEFRVRRAAAALNAAMRSKTGIRGARVATLLSNSANHVVTILACHWAGATLVPINTRLTNREISWIIADARVDLLVLDATTASALQKNGDMVELASTRFVQIEDMTVSLSADPVEFRVRDVSMIMYTSGTTGLPKPVELTWENISQSAFASALNLGLERDDNWLNCLPLFHIGGLSVVYRCLIYGIPMTLVNRFDEQVVSKAIDDWKVTLASFVPTMLHRLREVLHEPGTLRAVLLGGGPAPMELLEWASERDLPVYQTYGLTEGGSQITTMPPDRVHDKMGSAGFPIFGADVEIRYANNVATAPREHGHIWIRGPMLMRGYLNRDVENARRFDGEWFDTGDFGYLDEDGFLYVLSRRDDLIITGGENVYPAEVENVILKFPGVVEVAVFGLEDETWGEIVCAAIVGQEGLDLASLNAYCRESVAGFKVPKQWFIVRELPHTASGKVRRHELKLLDADDAHEV